MKQGQSTTNNGVLYIVATPIGNLSEITFRAIEVLKAVDVIASEDTRKTAVLLNRYEIKTPLISYHKFNEKERAEELIAKVLEGKNVAVVSDAGMPCISDPGAVVVRLAREAGVAITVISGATALINALILSGMSTERFCFLGFLPERKKERESLFAEYKNSTATLIFYCAPHDVKETLKQLFTAFGEREVCLVRELTKIYEEVVAMRLGEELLAEPRGEYVIVVEGSLPQENPLNSLKIEEHVTVYLNQGIPKMEAIKKTAKDRGIQKNDVYGVIMKKD